MTYLAVVLALLTPPQATRPAQIIRRHRPPGKRKSTIGFTS